MVSQLEIMKNQTPSRVPADGRPSKLLPPVQTLDVLDEVLESIYLKSTVTGPLIFTSPWGIRSGGGAAKFYIITHGECVLEAEDGKFAVPLVAGDFALVTQEKKHLLCDRPGSLAVPFEQVLEFPQGQSKEGSGSTGLVLGDMVLNYPGDCPLLSMLPPLIHVKGEKGGPAPWLNDLLSGIIRESASPQSGSGTIINRLVHILFIQAIRAYVATLSKTDDDRLSALLDPGIGPILRLLHHYPEKNWTVADLAEKACMSRSAFAARFTALVGHPPLSYLFLCRMNKACHLLRDPKKGIKEIAPRVGYASEAAFSNAFKRWAGTAPGNYRFTCRRH
jgi:AraC-like DNA-binding protein